MSTERISFVFSYPDVAGSIPAAENGERVWRRSNLSGVYLLVVFPGNDVTEQANSGHQAGL